MNILPQRSIFFPRQRKNCEKISPYFSLLEVENCPKLDKLFWEKLSRLTFLDLAVAKSLQSTRTVTDADDDADDADDDAEVLTTC